MNAKELGVVALALVTAVALVATIAAAVTLPSQADPRAVDATGRTTGADVTGHPNATVNGVPPGPPAWLDEDAPHGPPEWANTSGGPPTWITLP